MTKFKKIVGAGAVVLVLGVVGGTAFGSANHIVRNYFGVSNESNDSIVASDGNAAGNSNKTNIITTNNSENNIYSNVTEVAEAVLPSIVAINVTETVTGNYFGRIYEEKNEGTGSGIIIADKDNEILIATNNHVVKGADSVAIEFADGESVAASVRGTNADNDLAVVAVNKSDIKASTLNAIKIATLGNSDASSVGEMVVAIGNALGYGQSVTVGYISAKDREIDIEDGSMTLIQTDAAINPGNSGGALVNMKGEVIAINSAKFASEEVEGMGFAIPVATAVPIMQNIMNREVIPENEQAYMGISGEDIDAQYAEYYNIPQGIYIRDVTDDSPAEKAGLKEGMLITKIDGENVTGLSGLQEFLSGKRAGDVVTVTVTTGNMGRYSESDIKVTLGNKL